LAMHVATAHAPKQMIAMARVGRRSAARSNGASHLVIDDQVRPPQVPGRKP
jgi:hypothetical protein